jgi:uncharacterized membrane protein
MRYLPGYYNLKKVQKTNSMKKRILLFMVILIALIPVIYLAVIYNSLPSVVATHFSIDGKPDTYSNKSTLAWIVAFLSAITIGMYLSLTNLDKIDPKKPARLSGDTMQKIAIGITVLMATVSVIIIYSSANNFFSLTKVLLSVLGLFFVYIGNLMYHVKPNYFVGIRTPWTLENPDTWRKTHQLAGKLWFGGGLFITIATLSLSAKFALIFFLFTTAVITIIPIVYSYRYYQLHNNKHKNSL